MLSDVKRSSLNSTSIDRHEEWLAGIFYLARSCECLKRHFSLRIYLLAAEFCLYVSSVSQGSDSAILNDTRYEIAYTPMLPELL